MTIKPLTAKGLGNVPHGFLGRKGGASTGIYAGLNVGIGSGDDNDTVTENRKRAVNAILAGAQLATTHQIHSAHVIMVDKAVPDDERPHADGMVTGQAGILLGILTADCVPLLFADRDAGVVGAAHAGWKGAIGGVTDNIISMMEGLGARRDRIICAIGPCIAQKSYEVDEGFFTRFAADDPANERFFSDGKPGHYQFDIEGYVAARLAMAGIGHVECLGQDTYSQPDDYYSYRRACHRAENDYGRQISLIGLPE